MPPEAKAVGVCLWASGFSPCYWFLQTMGIQTLSYSNTAEALRLWRQGCLRSIAGILEFGDMARHVTTLTPLLFALNFELYTLNFAEAPAEVINIA